MKTKYIEIVIIYLLFAILFGGCVGVAPLNNGDVANLFGGFCKHIAENGGVLTQAYTSVETGITVFAKPFQDGWAVVLGRGQNYVGYFMNNETWRGFETWLTGAASGYKAIYRVLPVIPSLPVFVVPMFDGGWINPLDNLPGFSAGIDS